MIDDGVRDHGAVRPGGRLWKRPRKRPCRLLPGGLASRARRVRGRVPRPRNTGKPRPGIRAGAVPPTPSGTTAGR